MKNLLATFALLALACFKVHAADLWTPLTSVEVVYPTQSMVQFMVSYSNPTLSLCGDGSRFALDPNADDYSAQVAALLAAFAAGKQLKLVLDDSQAPNCAPIVNRFMVYR